MVKYHRGQAKIDAFEQLEAVNIRDVLDVLKYQFEGVSLALGLNFQIFPFTGEPWVFCDKEALADVISSLVHNSFSVCNKGDRVIIHLKQEFDRVFICVSDTGPGIEPDKLNEIFERGYPRRCVDGFSLNLFQIQSTIESLGGAVWAENRIGDSVQGARFIIALPIFA